MDQTTQKHSRISQLGRWLAELLLVFVGVYAAFWLNNYQQQREQIKRRDQILAYLEQRLRDGIDSAKGEGAKEEKLVAEFQRSLDPSTHKLRKKFEKYPEALKLVAKFFQDADTPPNRIAEANSSRTSTPLK
jgi:hypothetical protein